MFKLTKEEVTVWTPNHGYVRQMPSKEWCAYVDDNTANCDDGLRECGYQRRLDAVGPDGGSYVHDLHVYEHGETEELVILLDDSVEGWLAGVFVAAQHADAFMFTEYLRLAEQVARLNANDKERIAHKANLAFIRYGHGKLTVDEDGETRDEHDRRMQLRSLHQARRSGA